MFIARFFFILSHFVVVEDYEFSKKTVINSGIHQNSILIHLFFHYFHCVPDDVPTHPVTKHLTCCNKSLSFNLILQIKVVGNYFYFLSATFWFWSVKVWYLKLSIQTQTLEAIIQIYFKKSCYKGLKFLT